MESQESRKSTHPSSLTPPTTRASLSAVAGLPVGGVTLYQESILQRIPRHTFGKWELRDKPINAKMRELDRLLRMFTFDTDELNSINEQVKAEAIRWERELERRARYSKWMRDER